MEYTIELDLDLNEEKARPSEEVKEIIKRIFDAYHCTVTNIRVFEDGCEHDWHLNGMTVIDTHGWYYNEPSYRFKYCCSKCGKIKYEEE